LGLLEGGSAEVMAILKAAGARTEIRDGHGMTALDYMDQDAGRVSKYRQKDYESLRSILTDP
jgi:hypothetical protein